MLRSIGKQSGESVESVLEKKRKSTVERICRKWMKEWKGNGWWEWWVDATDGGSATQRTGWVRNGELSAWLTERSPELMASASVIKQRTSERAEVEVEDLGSQLVPRDAGIVQWDDAERHVDCALITTVILGTHDHRQLTAEWHRTTRLHRVPHVLSCRTQAPFSDPARLSWPSWLVTHRDGI